ncbi:MAG: hypothetical protein LBC41_08960 [Clostridiales bacterium]|jgi:hypothetical protein|nr:hypothetical protein [Clostridiales bacterium]MDR2750776.1 hypothetical protein [Clostridiales bacterium]
MKTASLKIFALASLALAILMMSGCAESVSVIAEAAQASEAPTDAPVLPDAPEAEEEILQSAEKGYEFSHNGASVALGGLASDFIASAGEPDKVFEAPSCAFVGVDKILYYPGFTVNTFPIDGVDYILAVVFTDDRVTTPEGIYLGKTRSDVETAYGEPSLEEENGSTYNKGGMSLRFVFEEDVAVGLKYYYDDSNEHSI